MKTMLKPTSVRFEPKLQKQLDATAKKINRSKAWVVQEAVQYYLAERVDLEIALEKLKDPRAEYLDWKDVRDGLLRQD